MKISVELKLNHNPNDSVAAFADLVLDGVIVVHDVKLLRRQNPGLNGDKFMVAMPSKRLSAPCHDCGEKNHLRASYCNRCGIKLTPATSHDPAKWFADLIHPIDPDARGRIHFAVMQAYRHECRAAQAAGVS